MNPHLKRVLSHLKPSLNRVILSIIATYIYRNIYGEISGGIIPVLLFPSFYIAYIFLYYPENLNWKNEKPTIPEGNLVEELNILLNSSIVSIAIFGILYLSLNVFLYKNYIYKLYQKYV